jgi:membrane-associated protease RseP (regulator of RpoE activity)
MRNITILVSLFLSLTGCVTQPTKEPAQEDAAAARARAIEEKARALGREVDGQSRLYGIAYPIFKAAMDLCGEDVRPGLGYIALAEDEEMEEIDRAAFRRALGEQSQATVYSVVPDSAADRAGIRKGDILIGLDDWRIPPWNEGIEKVRERLPAKGEKLRPMRISLRRDGRLIETTLKPEKICNYRVRNVSDDKINAWVSGDTIMVTHGMMRFAEDDDELALVIGHELAHDIRGHFQKKRLHSILGLIIDGIFTWYGANTQGLFTRTGNRAFADEYESEADYIGLYIARRADHDIDGAIGFWRRLYKESPDTTVSAEWLRFHPPSPQRFQSIKKAALEIHSKEFLAHPLNPEFESRQARIEGEWHDTGFPE